jgi:transposase
MDAVLGIDIAKAKFAAALLRPDGKVRHKSCANTPTGFADLAAWLLRQQVTHVHATLEATGTYGEALALWLHDAGHLVSVVNPSVIHAYARTQLTRSKTDRIDAELIARFTASHQPAPWTPPAPEIRQLQALVRRLDALQGMRTQELNRLASGVTVAEVRASIETVIASLDAQIRARPPTDSGPSRSAPGPPRPARAAHHHSRHRRGHGGRPDCRAL